MLKILVCVKQVPGSSNVKVDEKTGLLIRPALGNKLNPYDLFAIEEGLLLKEANDACLKALIMGPPQARSALNECIWMGCDAGILVTDRAFGGADCLATSYTLSQAIAREGMPDLILCGKQTTDGDTAQVGAELAEHLGIPHLANVIRILSLGDGFVLVKAMQDDLVITERLEMPCLLCLDSDINTPRLPSYRRKKETGDAGITVLTLTDFDDRDPGHYGLKGSPTQVQKIFPPEKNPNRIIFRGEAAELAIKLRDLLAEKKFIQEG